MSRFAGRFVPNADAEIQRLVKEPIQVWKQEWVQPVPSSSYKIFKWVRKPETITFLQRNDAISDSALQADAIRFETEKAASLGQTIREPEGPGAKLHEDSQDVEMEGAGGTDTPTSGLGTDAGLTPNVSGQTSPTTRKERNLISAGAVSGGLGSVSGPSKASAASSLPIHMQNAVSSAARASANSANNSIYAPSSSASTPVDSPSPQPQPQVASEFIPQAEGLPTRPAGTALPIVPEGEPSVMGADVPAPQEGLTTEQRDSEMAEGGEQGD